MLKRCREFDWSTTPVGAVSGWPQTLCTAAQMVLASPFPNIILWGPQLIQLYNDGYRELMGNKHPAGLGQPTQQCWPEVWPINQPIYQRVWAGESLSFANALFPITRSGQLRDAWFTLAYSPVRDEAGQVAGVLVTVFETTQQVLEKKHKEQAQRALRQREQQFSLLVRVTSEMVYAMSADWQQMLQLDGKDYLASTTTKSGNWLNEYIPPMEQERVWAAIQQAIDHKIPFEAEHQVIRRDGSVGWVFSRAIPILNEAGQILEWVGAASDMTERKHAQLRQTFLLGLGDALSQIADPVAIQEVAARLLGEQLAADRTYYAWVEGDYEVAIIEQEYRRGDVPSVVGKHAFADFGSTDAAYRAGRIMVLDDVEDGHSVPDSDLSAFRALGIRSLVSVPLVKQGRTVASMTVLKGQPYPWTPQDVSLVGETAERTWSAVERARAEEALRQREAQLNAVFEVLPAGLALADESGKILRFNPALSQIWGTLPLPDSTADYAEWKARWVETGQPLAAQDWAMAKTLRTGEVVPGDIVEIERFDGGRATIINAAAPIRDAAGTIVGGIVAEIDITAQRQAEQALRQSEEKYRTLFESVDEGVTTFEVVFDEAGQAVDLIFLGNNAAFAKMTGLPPEVVGRRASEVVPGLESFWAQTYGRVAVTGESARFEHPIQGLDNAWFDVYASRAGGSGSRQVVIIYNNITERKRREQQQAFLLGFSDTLRSLSDPETIEQTSLNALADFLGLDRVYIATVYRGEDRAVIGPEYRRAELGLVPISGELHMTDFPEGFRQVENQTLVVANIATDPTLSERDRQSLGAIHLTALIVASVRKGQRDVIWALVASTTTPRQWTPDEVGLIETIAERTWAAGQRAEAEAALRQADQRKDEFLAMLAHELRNPLAPVRNGLQLLAQTHSADQVLATLLPMMNRQMDHLMRMVDDLLDVSRISRGRIDLRMQRIDLVQVVAQAVDAQRSLFTGAGRQLSTQLPDHPLYLEGDPTRLHQVVTNLLTNGLRYTHPGGQVCLRLEQVGEQALLRVHDDGIGLAADQLDAIFGLFVQVDKSVARSHGGLGLGLSLVQELVHRHGGQVAAYSPGLEQGSEFVVYLPLQVVKA